MEKEEYYSQHAGVTWDKGRKKWEARISIDGARMRRVGVRDGGGGGSVYHVCSSKHGRANMADGWF